MIERLFAALVLWLLVGAVHAQTNPFWGAVVQNGTAAIEYVTGGARFVGGVGGPTFVGRTFTAPSSGAQSAYRAFANETLRLGLGGSDLTVVAARGLTGGEIALAAAAALAVGAVAFDQVGSPIAKALGYDQFTIGDTRCTAHYTGWQCDGGGPPTPTESVCFQRSGDPQCFGSILGAAVYDAVYRSGLSSPACSVTSDNGVSWLAYCTGAPGYGGSATAMGLRVISTVDLCPASIDALNPAWSVPAGSPPDADGKCPTGRYNPGPLPYVADRIERYGDPTGFPDLARRIVEDLGKPITVHDPANLTGPGSFTGPPAVVHTVNPDGSTRDVTTTPTTNYTYNSAPNTINYTTTITTVTNNAGAVTTTTTTSGGGSPAQDPANPCTANPETVGCSKLGTPGSESPPWTEIPVVYSPVSVSGVAACPADISSTVRGWELRLHFQPACDAAPTIRLAVLVLATLSATMMVVLTVARQ